MQQLVLDVRPPHRPDLARFVSGANGELLAALEALLDGQGQARGLYVWGAPGSGKTYLLSAWAEAARARGREVAWGGLAAAEVVLADAIDTWDAAQQAAGFAVFNTVRAAGGIWVGAGRLPPADMPVSPELRTRLAWGLVFRLAPLTDEDKLAAMCRHAETLGFVLDPAVAAYLLSRSSRDMQTLLARVEALDRASLAGQRPVTLPLARQLLAG